MGGGVKDSFYLGGGGWVTVFHRQANHPPPLKKPKQQEKTLSEVDMCLQRSKDQLHCETSAVN